MKITKIPALLVCALVLTACTHNAETPADKAQTPTPEALQQQMVQVAQMGQAQAIAQIIDQAMADPCQPVNLFNNADESNKKEVNLINIACENLDLPELVPAKESAEAQDQADE